MKKIALITGATSGIGEACARKFAANAPEHMQIAEVRVLATHQANGYTFSKVPGREEHLP